MSVREAAFVLGLSESQARYKLKTGRLSWAVSPITVDVGSVRLLFPDDATRELRERVLRRLLAREIEAPQLGSRHERYSFDLLCAGALQWAPPSGWQEFRKKCSLSAEKCSKRPETETK